MCAKARVISQMSARHQGVVHSKVVDLVKAKVVEIGAASQDGAERDLEAKVRARDLEKAKARGKDTGNMGVEKEGHLWNGWFL